MTDLRKKKTGMGRFILFAAAAAFFAGCTLFGDQAPLKDGLYLTYDFDGSITRVRFEKVSSNKFRAIVDFGDPEDDSGYRPPAAKPVIVDTKLNKENGGTFEVGNLGPLWIPPSSVKPGGYAHGDTVDSVKHWKKWDVGVVKASFGSGALRGEWYYEKETGFLVGGNRSSVMDETDGGTDFILTDTNLEGLPS